MAEDGQGYGGRKVRRRRRSRQRMVVAHIEREGLDLRAQRAGV